MTYPSPEPEDYTVWVAPEHDCNFIIDTDVEVGVFENGETKVYELMRCNQCENTKAVPTGRTARTPR